MGVPQNNLGVARASIEFDLSQLQAGVAAARQAGAQIQQAFGQVSVGTKTATAGVTGLSGSFNELTRALGIASGAFAAIKLARFALEADTTATAYRRQSVAALSLAGSQSKLNDLLSTYDRVTGGVMDKSTALADVTKLQAIGFADTTAELERFTTAARGISVGMGRDQGYVISQLQLEMTSQRGMRLDQIGLGIAEVRNKAKQLQDADSSLTKEMAYQNAVLDVAIGKFGALTRSAEAQATGQEKASKAWKNFSLAMGEALGGVTGGLLDAASVQVDRLGKLIVELKKYTDEQKRIQTADMPGATGIGHGGSFGQRLGPTPAGQTELPNVISRYGAEGQMMRQIAQQEANHAFIQANQRDLQRELASGTSGRSNAEINADLATQASLLTQVNAALADLTGSLHGATSQLKFAGSTAGANSFAYQFSGPVAGGIDPNLEKQNDDKVAFYEAAQKIDRDAGQARLDATQQYESARSETVYSYEQGIAREEQDFGISRVRQASDLADNIARIGLDSSRQATKWAEDLANNIAKMTEDSGKRLADAQETSAKRINEINEQYAKNREKALRDHNDNLLDAAANLDAKAVFNEQKAFARSSADAKDAHDTALAKESEGLAERTEKEAENLAERIQQAQEANAKQLANAKEADAIRIQDAKDALVKQQAQEDEDRALRLARGAEDQAHQLAQMDIAQGERLAQIDQHAAEERKALEEDFLKQLDEDGLRNAKWYAQQQALKALALKQFDEFWLHVLGSFGKMNGPISQADKDRFIDPTKLKGFESGGPIRQTGAFWGHAGEVVLNKNIVDRMGGFAGVQQMAMAGGRGHTLNLSDGAITINAAANHNVTDIAYAVRSELLNVFENELQ